MELRLSERKTGRAGIVGHVGVGHVHSAAGLVQDDSAGFAVAADILRAASGADLTIDRITCMHEKKSFCVKLKGGGSGEASARRGITPAEAELAQRARGMDGALCQAAAGHAFGRVYGQGAAEAAVALEGAIARAVVDTFRKKIPKQVRFAECGRPGLKDCVLGSVVEIDRIPTALLLVVNMTEGGIGPVEDLEGNVCEGAKGEIMKLLGLDFVPTIVIESKAYSPAAGKNEGSGSFLVRARDIPEEKKVADQLLWAAKELGMPAEQQILPPRELPGALRKKTQALADKILACGVRLREAESSMEKVRLAAELCEIASQEMGGISFMSNDSYDVVGGFGLMQGSGAVLSYRISREEFESCLIPSMQAEDLRRYRSIAELAVCAMGQKQNPKEFERKSP